MPALQDEAALRDLLRQEYGDQIDVRSEGSARARILTPFRFEDGDLLTAVLIGTPRGWMLTDEGSTLMRLSYEVSIDDVRSGNRGAIYERTLSMFGLEESDGMLELPTDAEHLGSAVTAFAQAVLRLSDLTFLSRPNVRSTFVEDFKRFLSETVPAERLTFDWTDSTHDREGYYPVDARVNGMARPLMVFALTSDRRVSEAQTTLLTLEKWGLAFQSLAVFEDQEKIGRRVLARFTDVCDRQFSSLASSEGRLRDFLQRMLAAPAVPGEGFEPPRPRGDRGV